MAMRRARLLLLLVAIGVATSFGFAVAPSEALVIESWSVKACARTATSDDLEHGCLFNAPSASIDVNSNGTGRPDPAFKAVNAANATAGAFQSPGGYDRARADAATQGTELDAAAAAQFVLTVRNNTSTPEAMTFRFLISNAALSLAIRNFVADDVPMADIFSEVTTKLDSDLPVTRWHYNAFLASLGSGVLVGLQDSLNFVDPQGIGKPGLDSFVTTPGQADADFAPFVGTLDLGMLPAGAEFTLTYTIGARAYTGSLNTVIIPSPESTTVSVSALIEDPFSLDSGFFLNGRSFASLTETASDPPATGVPAPAEWLLLGVGLAAIAAARLRMVAIAIRRARLLLLLLGITVAVHLGFTVARSEALVIVDWLATACAMATLNDELEHGCTDTLSSAFTDNTFPGVASKSISYRDSSANASQSPGGWDRARADAAQTFDLAAAAQASFRLHVLNDSATPQPMVFRFLISNAALALAISNYVADDAPMAEIFSDVRTEHSGDAFPVIQWHYDAFLASLGSGTLVGMQDTLNFVDPQGIGKPALDSFSTTPGQADADFAPFVGTLDLGILPAGAEFTLFYSIGARSYTGTLNTVIIPSPESTTVSLSALIEDPFSLDSGFFLNGQSLASLIAGDTGTDGPPASGVPAPAAWLLLSAGLVAVAAGRRRRR